MKISLSWLADYIELKDYRGKVSELAKILTAAGLEVENIEDPAKHWHNVVIGKIIKKDPHPDADKLSLCQVDVGDRVEQIVCGASNHQSGDLVVVALPGAVLPGDFKIKKSKIRGVESNGMLCSETELGLSEQADGIMILSGSPRLGMAFAEWTDRAAIVFTLNVTPNRADCLSHLGLARELATLLDRPLKKPTAALNEGGSDIANAIKVELRDAKACPRYCGRLISGVKVGPSPDWLQSRLAAVGLKSINNIVDITNYVLFEYGQPLHAFDYHEIKKQTIVVEKARAGEKFTTLDGTELSLSVDDLLIRDGDRGVALAGVIGGQNSGITEKTTDIFLESAFFAAEGVRKTARAHGIETDSCYRFSRGVDPQETLNALNRAASLIVELAGGQIRKGQVDLYPEPLTVPVIKVATSYVAQRVGYEVHEEEFAQWLVRLNCQVSREDDWLTVRPPSYRWDLAIPEDLVEEFARLNGYDKIVETLPSLVTEPTSHVASFTHRRRVSEMLTGLGCFEAINYAFIAQESSRALWGSEAIAEQCGLRVAEPQNAVRILNPISAEMSVMRESLLPGLLQNVIYNHHHGVSHGRLFEIGPTHYLANGSCQENFHLAFAFWGEPEGLWQQANKNYSLFFLKSVLESLLTKLGGKSWRWQSLAGQSCPPGFHPGQAAALNYEGQLIGAFGTLHPLVQSANKIRHQVAWGEFDFAKLMVRQPRNPKYQDIPKFPGVERDIALVAPLEVTAEEIGNQLKKLAGPLLENYRIFDIYQDTELTAAGRRSIAFRLRFQSDTETLSDDKINRLRDEIVQQIRQKLPVESR